MLKKIFFVIIGIVLLSIVVFLGVKASRESGYIIWFGLAAAILPTVGFSAIGYAFKPKEPEILRELAKVPEIGKLVEQAKTVEEKIRLLQDEKERIAEIVKLESRRQVLLERKNSLEKDGIKTLKELEAVERELKDLGIDIQSTLAQEEIQRLYAKLKGRIDKDIIIPFGSREYIIKSDYILKMFPFGLGGLIILYLRMIEPLLVPKHRTKRRS